MSRPITVKELRRVLRAAYEHATDACDRGQRNSEALFACDIMAALDALAALPAEQEPITVAAVEAGIRAGSVAAAAINERSLAAPSSYLQPAASKPQDSAVPELPPDALLHGFATSVYASTYRELRTAAESLRERLVGALEAGEHWHKQWQSECDENISLRKQLVPALQERDDAIARAEQAEAERDALRSQIEEAQRQEPVAWVTRNSLDLLRRNLEQRSVSAFRHGAPPDAPLYAAPVPAADVAQQIAAAEQRGRAAAFEDAAREFGSLNLIYGSDVAARCRRLAEEARG